MTMLDTCASRNPLVYVIILLHQWIQIELLFEYPYDLYVQYAFEKHTPFLYHFVVCCVLGYIQIQNNSNLIQHVSRNPQTCVVSQYTNNACGRPATDMMQDPMYYLGFKKNIAFYSYIYNKYSILILTCCVSHLTSCMFLHFKKYFEYINGYPLFLDIYGVLADGIGAVHIH